MQGLDMDDELLEKLTKLHQARADARVHIEYLEDGWGAGHSFGIRPVTASGNLRRLGAFAFDPVKRMQRCFDKFTGPRKVQGWVVQDWHCSWEASARFVYAVLRAAQKEPALLAQVTKIAKTADEFATLAMLVTKQ